MQQSESPRHLLYEVVHVLFKWKWLIVIAFVTTFTGIIGGTYIVTPRWKATTKLLVQQNPRLQPVIFDDLVQPGQLNPRVRPAANLVEILTGRKMAADVNEAFRLDERLRKRATDPEKTRDQIKYWLGKIVSDYPKAVLIMLGLAEEEERDYEAAAIKDFMDEWVDVAAAEDSDVISIGVWGESPELATEISRFMSERVAAETLALTAANISTTYKFAKAQMPAVAEKLRAAEDELGDFRREQSITVLEDEMRIKMARLDKVEADLAQVEVNKKENVERIRELKGRLDEQESKIIEAGFIAGNSLIVNMKTSIAGLEAELSSILTEKKESHPDVIRLRKKITSSKDSLRDEIRRIVDSETEITSPIYQDLVEKLITAEIDEFLFSVRWVSLGDTKENIENSLMALSDKKIELARLFRRVEVLERLAKDFELQLEELHLLEQAAINEIAIRVIDPGYVPPGAEPRWPRLDVAAAVGFIFSLIFALMLPFVLEFWSDSPRASEVGELLEKPVIGEVFRV